MAKRKYDCSYSLFLIGDVGAGKTSIINCFKDPNNKTSPDQTFLLDSVYKDIKLLNKRIRLQIVDTSGLERYNSISAYYYRRANGIILVYSVDDETSFKRIHFWMDQTSSYIREDTVFLLVGSKSDLEEQRQVSTLQGEELAKSLKINFIEVSSKLNQNVIEAFETIVKDISITKQSDPEKMKLSLIENIQKQLSEFFYGHC